MLTSVIDDVPQRRLVVVVMLLALALDAAAAPAFASALARADGELHLAPSVETWSALASDVAYLATLVASLWTMANVGKRVYLTASLAGFAIAMAGCALAPSATIFVAARIAGSIALGGFFSSALLTIVGASPKAELPLAMAFFSLVSLAAPTLAPLYASTLLGDASWRAVFGCFALPSALGALVTASVMRDASPRSPSRFDGTGFATFVVALIAFRAFAAARALAGENAATLGATAGSVAVVTLVVFVRRQTTAATPRLVDTAIARTEPIARGLLVCVLVGVLVRGPGFEIAYALTVAHVAPVAAANEIAWRLVGIVIGVGGLTLPTARAIAGRAYVTAGALAAGATAAATAIAIAANAGLAAHVAIGIVTGAAFACIVGPLASTLFGAVDRVGFAPLAIAFKLAIVAGGSLGLALATVARDVSQRFDYSAATGYAWLWTAEAVVAFVIAALAPGLRPRLASDR